MATYKQVGYGSQGSDVKTLQNMLNSNGYKLSVDGIFGSKTQAAVKDYQKKNNLAVDGIVGKNTWGSLTGTANTIPGGGKTGAISQTLPGGTGGGKASASSKTLPGGGMVGASSKTLPGGGMAGASAQTLPGGTNTSKPGGSAQTLPGGMAGIASGYNQVLPGTTGPSGNLSGGASGYGPVLPGTTGPSGNLSGGASGSSQVLPGTTGPYGSNGGYSQDQGYQSTWQASVDEALQKILNREEFSYDLNGDALYQQYKDQYTMQGQQAMMDTMGQAQAMTGGYGNSYAQSVGQQAYQGHLQQLNDIVPELYQMALDKYQREGEDLYKQYGIIADRENQEYGRYRDLVGDQQWQSQFDYQKERDQASDQKWQTEFDYQQGRDAVEDQRWYDQFQYQKDRDSISDQRWQSEFDYQQGRDAVEDQRWKDQFDYQKDRDKTSDDQWQAEFDEAKRRYDQEWEKENPSKKPSTNPSPSPSPSPSDDSSGDKKTGYDNGGINETYIKALQRMLGVTADGKWGPATAAAAKKKWGVSSAKDAYMKVYGSQKGGNPGNDGNSGNDGFNGSSYKDAVDYMKKNGVSPDKAAGAMTQTEWQRRKNSKNGGGAEVKNYDSYQEYLKDYVQYQMENK